MKINTNFVVSIDAELIFTQTTLIHYSFSIYGYPIRKLF